MQLAGHNRSSASSRSACVNHLRLGGLGSAGLRSSVRTDKQSMQQRRSQIPEAPTVGERASAVSPLVPGRPPLRLPGPRISDKVGSQANHLFDCLDLGPSVESAHSDKNVLDLTWHSRGRRSDAMDLFSVAVKLGKPKRRKTLPVRRQNLPSFECMRRL